MNFKGQEAYKVDFNGIVENEEIIGKIISYNIDHKNICLLHFASNKNFIKTENEFNDLLNSLKIKLKPRLSDSETNPDSFSLYKKSTEFSLLYPKSWSEVRLNPGELFLRATTNKNIGGVIMLQKVVAVDDNIILSEKSYLENFSKRLNGAILESDFYNYKDYFVAYTKSRTFDGENHNISLHFAYFKKDIQYVYYITVYEDYYKLNKSEIDKIAFSLRLYQ